MLSTPDVTPAQVIAVVGAVLGVLAAAGLPLSATLQDSIITLVTVLAPLVIIGDAHIRHGRSRALAIPPRPLEEEKQVGA
ncbi:MAG TPA: hypothetical protein VE644_09685 [Gaiellaceae bacterium]|jgi:hypothetical protein|nr:hypothetical protein [Gaiellaceae bacterium]